MNPDTLRRHVQMMADQIGPRHPERLEALDRTARYIEECLQASFTGRLRRQSYSVQNVDVSNLIFSKPGQPGLPLIVVGAHYDTCPGPNGDGGTPGADDNASAVAGLIELARHFAAIPTRHPMAFVAFTLEEPPYFGTESMGSSVYARSLRSAGADIRLMICLEMIGYFRPDQEQEYPMASMKAVYPRYADFIAAVTNDASAEAAGPFLEGFRHPRIETPTLIAPGPIPGIDLSDHRSFWAEGMPAVMVTDTATYRNPNYHRDSDVASTLDYDRMAWAIAATATGIETLDQRG